MHETHPASFGLKEIIATLQFLVMLAIIFFASRKMIKEALKLRAENISKKIVDAKIELERIQFEAHKAKQEIASMNQTRDKLINEVKLQGQKLYDQLVVEAKDTASRILADSKLAAQNEVAQAVLRLKQEVVDQAIKEALKISEGSESRAVLNKGLIDQFNESKNSPIEGINGVV